MVLWWCLLLGMVAASGVPCDMPLHLVPKDVSEATGAVCLDGSPPGFYFHAASHPATNTSWVLYFKGGGWCYDEASCAKRSKSELGTSTKFPSEYCFGEGPVSPDPTLNPTFSAWNRVILWYCDGASFSGDKTDPITVGGEKIYFRGKRNLDAILNTLKKDYGMDQATQVLLSGGSAGGLSTYLHADYVRTQLPSTVTKYRAAPVSGYFLLHSDVVGTPVYPQHMKYVYKMQNSSGGVNPLCHSALQPSDQWQCIFAQMSYAHSKVPTFVLNSALDSWQMNNIFVPVDSNMPPAERAEWDACLKSNFGNCTTVQIKALNGYRATMLANLKGGGTFQAPGHGAFLDTCKVHVEAQGRGWSSFVIGGVTMRDAVTAWWNAPDTDPAAHHTYLPCELTTTSPHQCNPTCGKAPEDPALYDPMLA